MGHDYSFDAEMKETPWERTVRRSPQGAAESAHLVDVRLELWQRRVDEGLLVRRERAEGLDARDALRAELDGRGEVLQVLADLLLERGAARRVRLEVHKARRDDARLAAQGAYDLFGELRARVRHGERRGASAVLGLDDLVAAVLDTGGECHARILREIRGQRRGRLREQRDDLRGARSARCLSVHKRAGAR